METARQTALMEQPEIVELFRVLEGNGLTKEQKEMESLVKYLDGMEVQFGQVLEELRDVKEQLSQIQDGGVKASVLRIAEQAQGKVQEVGGQLNTVRKNLIQSAGNALQTYKEKGKDALRNHSKDPQVIFGDQWQALQYGTDHRELAPASGTVRAEGGKETVRESGTEKAERGEENGSSFAGSGQTAGKRIGGELQNETSEDQREMVSGRTGGMRPAVWRVAISSDQPLCGRTESGGRIYRTGTDRGADRRYVGGRTGRRGAGSYLSLRAVCRAVCHE